MARLFKRGGIWYAWVPRPEGGTRKVTTQCTDERAARDRAAELERESLDPDGAAAKKATLRDALELLIRDRAGAAKAGKGSKATVEFYQKKSGVLLDALAEVLRRSPKAAIFIHEVKPALVDDYIAQRREDGVEDSTIAKELTTWRAAMRIAKRRRWFRLDIDEVFPIAFSSASKPRERWVTPEEFLKLHAAMVRPIPTRKPNLSPEQIAELRARRAAGERLRELAPAFGVSYPTAVRLARRDPELEPVAGPEQGHALFAIVCFAIATSAEWSAIWRARREDIAGDLSVIRVRGSKNENRDRPVPIALFGFGLLADYARRFADGELADEEGTFLFKGAHASSFRHRLREACKRAGIPPLSPNDLRRTHAKWLRLSGVAPATIAPSMGHADARMVERVYGKSSAMELAGVQRAQIATGGGLLMGGGAAKTEPSRPLLSAPHQPVGPENQPPDGALGRNRTADTGIFNPPRPVDKDGREQDSPTRWAANGQLTAAARTAPGEPPAGRGDAPDPGAPPLEGAHVAREERPGPARARAPITIDGRDVWEAEELSDLAALLPLAGGRR